MTDPRSGAMLQAHYLERFNALTPEQRISWLAHTNYFGGQEQMDPMQALVALEAVKRTLEFFVNNVYVAYAHAAHPSSEDSCPECGEHAEPGIQPAGVPTAAEAWGYKNAWNTFDFWLEPIISNMQAAFAEDCRQAGG